MAIFNKFKSLFSKKSDKKSKPLDDEMINDDLIDEDSEFDEDEDVINVSENQVNNKKDNSKKNFKTTVKEGRDGRRKGSGDFDWFSDRYQSLVVQRNISIFLLIIAIVCITCTGISLAVITNSKTIEPFVIEIEKKQGLVTYIDNNQKMREYTQDEILRNYFIKRYVEARETFDTKNYDYFYHKVVKTMSTDAVYRQFLSILRSSSRENPVNLLANNEVSKVTITSITPIKPKVLQVRFVVEGRFSDGSTVRSNRIAILEYNYFNVEIEEAKRYINPLGFVVTSYKASDENVK
jgi:type IV secretion system protein VirB8